MMGTLFDQMDRAAILRRVGGLTPERMPMWGKFTAPEMVCHVSAGLRQALGDLDAGKPWGPFRFPVINWLAINVFPWPKGKAKSPPALLGTKPTSWDGDITALRELIERFGQRGPSDAWPLSAAFGKISGKSWGVLEYRHLDHHLRQFNV
jgi:hypothetical protein